MINTDLENASKIMIGSQEAEAIYVGSNLIWQQSSPLPYDAEIEYLESTGTQWIDTGIIPTINTKSQIKFCNLNATGAVIFGYNTGDDHIDYRLFNYSSNLYFDIPGNQSFISEGNRLTSDTYKININSIYELELGNFYVKDLTTNNIIVNSTPCNNFGEINNSITLNAGYENYSTYVISSNKWYYVKIYENNTLILNLIPVRIGQIGYMYDKVSGQLFGNQGTGNFVLGPDKDLPNGYTKLEYISSTNGGNQYIDLGIKLYEVLNTDYDIAMKFNIASGNANQAALFACQDSDNDPWPGTFVRVNSSAGKVIGRYIGGSAKDNTIGSVGSDLELPVQTAPNKNVTSLNNSNNTTHQYGTSLFCAFVGGTNTPDRYCNAKLYYFKLFVNGTLVRDMIPCKNPSNVVGLYDLVNHRFYSSPNGNAFVAGPVVSQNYVTDGLIFHLDGINKGTGTGWTDLIGNLQYTAESGCVTTNNAYQFTGQSDSYLYRTHDWSLGSEDLTVEVCYYDTEANNSCYYVFGMGGSNSSKYPLFYKNTNSEITWIQGGNVYDGSSMQPNTKYTISLNGDSGLVNGNSIPIKNNSDYWDVQSNYLRIGCASTGAASSNPLIGYIYSIRIYNRKLSQSEQLQNQRMDNLRFNLGLSI